MESAEATFRNILGSDWKKETPTEEVKAFRGRFIRVLEKAIKCEVCDRYATFQGVCPVDECHACFHDIGEAQGHFSREVNTAHQVASPFLPMKLGDLAHCLSTTIRHDRVTKCIAFIAMLNAQTENEQFNIMLSSGSSTGKSYIPLEIASYFPESELIELSAASPTSFIHDRGTEVVERNNQYVPISELLLPLQTELEELEKTDKARAAELKRQITALYSEAKIFIDLEGKIIIFLDQPNHELLARMRSFFSHDKKQVEFSITDKSKSGSQRTKHVLIQGPASAVYCTTAASFDEQESTRNFVVSAESNASKIDESLELLAFKKSDRDGFYKWLDSNPLRKALLFRVEMIRVRGVRKFVSSQFNSGHSQFKNLNDKRRPRDSRDFERIISLMHGHALLNCFNHSTIRDEDTIEIDMLDTDAAFALFAPIMDANRAGVSPETWAIFKQVITPLYEQEETPVSYAQIQEEHQVVFTRPIPYTTLKNQHIKSMIAASLIIEEKDGQDHRKSIFTPVYQNIPSQNVGLDYVWTVDKRFETMSIEGGIGDNIQPETMSIEGGIGDNNYKKTNITLPAVHSFNHIPPSVPIVLENKSHTSPSVPIVSEPNIAEVLLPMRDIPPSDSVDCRACGQSVASVEALAAHLKTTHSDMFSSS